MANIVRPRVFHLATTKVVDEVRDFLTYIGAPEWETDAECDHALLTEIAGRACYRSFGVGLNKNVTRTRQGSSTYLRDSILGAKHGSVLEHSTDTFAIVGLSRIVTHELVRHRSGTAFSQESGRYVRVDELDYYYPEVFSAESLYELYVTLHGDSDPIKAARWVEDTRDSFSASMIAAEMRVVALEKSLGLDDLKDFGLKKKLQSAIRRLAPTGQSTKLVMTANHRAWRHIVEMRTSAAAEEEIRIVAYEIYRRLAELHPAIYQDAIESADETALPSSVPVVTFENEKV